MQDALLYSKEARFEKKT